MTWCRKGAPPRMIPKVPSYSSDLRSGAPPGLLYQRGSAHRAGSSTTPEMPPLQ